MPNNDYILRSDAMKALRYYKNCREENHVPSIDDVHLTEYQLLAQAINNIPAADVEPVRHGKWIKSPEYPEEYDICSVCGLNDKHRTRADQEHPAFESLPLYCKYCGAKMEVEPPKGETDEHKKS